MKVYQAQYWSDYAEGWGSISTKSGGTFYNTLRGARSKLIRFQNTKTRVVSFELVNEKVGEEYVD